MMYLHLIFLVLVYKEIKATAFAQFIHLTHSIDFYKSFREITEKHSYMLFWQPDHNFFYKANQNPLWNTNYNCYFRQLCQISISKAGQNWSC